VSDSTHDGRDRVDLPHGKLDHGDFERGGAGRDGDGTLVFMCHMLAALVLVAPVVAAGITRDLTVLAVGGVAALLIVRALIVNVVPWLERRGGRAPR